MCEKWYNLEVRSNNFQLHPPRGKDTNLITNTCGNLLYPLMLCAERGENGYSVKHYDLAVLKEGACKKGDPTAVLDIMTD